MTFPLDAVVELKLAGVWTDITADVYQRDPITIGRGRTAEGGQVDPSRCNLTIDNTTGDYSPRNPTGAHFGVLGRNTPLRVRLNRVEAGDNGMFETDASGWSGAGCTVARTTDQAHGGAASLKMTATGAGTMTALTASGVSGMPVSPGETVTAEAWFRAATVARSCRIQLGWWDAAGGSPTTVVSASVVNTTTGWTQISFTATAPAGTAFMRVGPQVLAPAGAGEIHYVDDVTINDIRFSGEVSSWPQKWDTGEADVWVPIEAAGIMRRLGQGQTPLKSALFRALTSGLDGTVRAYWPCEDSEDATELASALPGHPPMTPHGQVDMASFTDFKASAPIPTGSGKQWPGVVPTYTATGSVQVRFLMAVPAAGVAGTSTVCRIRTDGTAPRWDLTVDVTGNLQLRAFDSEDVDVGGSGLIAFDVNGRLLRVSIELKQNGANVDRNIATLEVGATSGLGSSGSVTGVTVGRAEVIRMNVGGNLTDTALGHVSLQDAITTIFDIHDELNAWTGEAAGRRVERLCAEEGVTFSSVGALDDTTAMGYQLPKTLLDLLREAADSDLGILYEPRAALGLAYRTRASLYAQDAALGLDYATADMSSIEPVDDDQNTRNDVTAKRDGGSSVRAELTTGALSTAAPPNGVGRYDEEVTISVEADSDLTEQAGWRLHLGTVDEARYPVLGTNLATDSFTGDAALTADAQALDMGDRLTVANPPAWLPPEDIQQLAQGFTEVLTRHQWTIDVNCSPASPWDVGVWDDSTGPGEARYSSDGSTLAGNLTTTAPGVFVVTASGPLWTDVDQPFDIIIGGERMTVTDIDQLTASPQIFTVTRSVNGVVKAHLAGAEVRLFKPAVYAL